MATKKTMLSILAMVGMFGDMTEPIPTGLGILPPSPKLGPKPEIPYYKQEGIVKMIKQYNLIIISKCTLGKRKQARVIEKIEAMLDSGMLLLEHIQYKEV